jgi:cell cycle checkpoint control protein RAD9A
MGMVRDLFVLIASIPNNCLAILKQPLQTTIALDIQEFGGFEVDKRLHIVISVKDFKAIMMHAGTSNTIVSAAYSSPFQPMRLRYDYDGFSCEFILQTIGDARGQSTTPAPRAVGASQARSLRKLPVEPMPNRPASSASAAGSMAPPSRSAAPSLAREAIRARNPAPSPPQPQPSQHDNLLFVPEDDDDRRWDPADEGDEDVLGWDASADNVSVPVHAMQCRLAHQVQNIARPTIQPSGQALRSQQQNDSARPNIISAASQHIHPTQRMSQVRLVGIEV